MPSSTAAAAKPLAVNDQVRLKPYLSQGTEYAGVVFRLKKLPQDRSEVNAEIVPISGGASVQTRPLYLELVA
jgi:hypothetical protein